MFVSLVVIVRHRYGGKLESKKKPRVTFKTRRFFNKEKTAIFVLIVRRDSASLSTGCSEDAVYEQGLKLTLAGQHLID